MTRFRTSILLIQTYAWLTLFASGVAVEVPKPKVQGIVIGHIWHSKVDARKMMQHTRDLGQELGMRGTSILSFIGVPGR